jgi:hypothetical protein
MDGSSYIQSLVELAELGRSYLTNVPAGEGPTEPLHTALSLLRTKLYLVGFFNATVFAGRADAESSHSHIANKEARQVQAGMKQDIKQVKKANDKQF